MKKLSFKNLSVLGLVLMGVSAITTAMIPSKSNTNVAVREDGDGEGFPSSVLGEETVRFVEGGQRSYTITDANNNNGDGFSATSQNDLGTYTFSNVAEDTDSQTSII